MRLFTFIHARLHLFTFVHVRSPPPTCVHFYILFTMFTIIHIRSPHNIPRPIMVSRFPPHLPFHYIFSPLLSFSPSHAVSLCRYHIAVICRHVAMTFCCYVVAVVTCRYVLFCRHCRHCRDLAGAEIPRISVPHMNRLRESPTGIAWTPPGCVGVDVRRNL